MLEILFIFPKEKVGVVREGTEHAYAYSGHHHKRVVTAIIPI